ncbi:MAG: 50S ribosomal protein L11 methyltransferase [Deltaproteobacteria bacterium]|nr:50S ribosomal protein L11 methyltransferase [Deltaproteobacteria bacterium]
MSDFFTLTVELPEASTELAESLLHDAGCLGLEIRDTETKPMPGQRVPPPGRALLVAYFQGRESVDEVKSELADELPGATFEIEGVVEQDWSESWKAQIKATTAGRLWVGPPWLEKDAPARSTKIVIEPGMAFGTGDHPTTHFCLEALDRALSERHGASVLDVGTGSAVLAIAARKLGAGRVVGTDNDPVAIRVALENAERNGATDLELSTADLHEVSGTFDIVLANILANTLTELAEAITAKVAPRGLLVLAGILSNQAEEVLVPYLGRGLQLRTRVLRGEWAMLELERP